MKKLAALLTALIPLVSTATVQADPWEGFYAGAIGGANFLQTRKKAEIDLNFKTGYMVGGFVGYRWCEGFRVEGEVSYRRNTLKSVDVSYSDFEGDSEFSDTVSIERVHGHHSLVTYMANLLYEIDTCSSFTPYVGAGIGYGHEITKTGLCEDKDNGFAWQAIAGVEYTILPCTDLAIEYRFLKGPESRLYNHTVGLVAKYHF